MATKYGFSDVREQLVGGFSGAYPTKWEVFEAAGTLGEDVFGSPTPHPNAVLNLFLEQSIKSVPPFATYRASLGGFSALVSDKPSAVLPHLTLASIIHARGAGEILRVMTRATHTIAYKENLPLILCLNEACLKHWYQAYRTYRSTDENPPRDDRREERRRT